MAPKAEIKSAGNKQPRNNTRPISDETLIRLSAGSLIHLHSARNFRSVTLCCLILHALVNLFKRRQQGKCVKREKTLTHTLQCYSSALLNPSQIKAGPPPVSRAAPRVVVLPQRDRLSPRSRRGGTQRPATL